MAEQPVDKLAKAEEQIADLRQDRDQWREAQRRATLPSSTPPETPAPTPWWRWLRSTGCLAGAGIFLALATGAAAAQQQQRECFAVALNPQASLGSILIDKCSGKTWLLGRSGSRFSNAIRWFPITTDTNEPTGENLSPR